MAKALWGKVYYADRYAGILREEGGGRYVFSYDPDYLQSGPAISFSLPLQAAPFISENGLHPFFDNLVAEGWLERAQMQALGEHSRFALLLGFGHDLAGAVSIIDPESSQERLNLSHLDNVTRMALRSRASLSGVQRKLLVVKQGNRYRPVEKNESSTHFAKLPSGDLKDIIDLEYLTTLAMREFLPGDPVVELEISSIDSIHEEALIIKRFDRTLSGQRIHFEEFNQLLGHTSIDKYNGSYEDMGDFLCSTSGGLILEADKLYKRILVCLLLGNTDAHFKNFAMFHTREGLRLTPNYDLVAASAYKQFSTIALGVGGAQDLQIGSLKPKHLLSLAVHFGLNEKVIVNTFEEIEKKIPEAVEAISSSNIGSKWFKEKLIDIMEKRWKGSFNSIGKLLSKRQNKGVSLKTLRKEN